MLTLLDEFSGVGGSTEGAVQVPGVVSKFAANHNLQAKESHEANHPDADHYLGDVQKISDVGEVFPPCNLFWASPACPDWTDAKGKKRTFDTANQLALWKEDPTEEELKAMRSRALMEEVVIYLRAMHRKGKPVLAGIVENVIQCRKWADWDRWIREIEALGYETKVIALNSMHAQPRKSPRAPQSRDRLYVAYWRTSLKRRPNWDKWLRPKAYCPSCHQPVDALQSFKRFGQDMGRYRSQYVYRCPRIACRGQIVEPEALAAATAINWAIPGTPIGERKDGLKPNTIARIEAGIRRYWEPLLTPSGGTWRDQATPLSAPMPTRTTRECDGIAIPPLVVPVEGRDGKQAAPATDPIRTQTCRRETALVFPPFVTPMRGGGDKEKARPITDPLHTVTSGGNHHGVVTSPDPLLVPYYSKSGARPVSEPLGALSTQIHYGVAVQDPLLVPYYGTGTARPASDPVGTLSTRDRYGLAQPGSAPSFDIDEVRFRMLDWEEIRAAMAFRNTYLVLPASKRDKVRLLGNAVTPPVAEVLMSALVECITGEDLEAASC